MPEFVYLYIEDGHFWWGNSIEEMVDTFGCDPDEIRKFRIEEVEK